MCSDGGGGYMKTSSCRLGLEHILHGWKIGVRACFQGDVGEWRE